MYNSSTAGAYHVHLFSQVRGTVSLSTWHLILVMCHPTHSVGAGGGLVSVCFTQMCVWPGEKYLLMYTVMW